ncbi:MAG: cytochrome c oxidase subunit 3 [Pirellulales bacterium]
MTSPAGALAHHFANLDQQRTAARLGMWIFLLTEVMFFGGAIGAYCVYRSLHPAVFEAAGHELSKPLGTLNTVVLITSSLTMAMAVLESQTGDRRRLLRWLLATMGLGVAFLGIKGIEWYTEYLHHRVPGLNFTVDELGPTAELFFACYFALTGLHALHMIIGLAVMGVLVRLAYLGRLGPERFVPVDVTGLYWHFVDIVWIFLFPLLYLL